MSNRRKLSDGFVERTTSSDSTGVTITPPETSGDTHKSYIGSDHKPTEEEALEMGRRLFDDINAKRASDARASK